MRGQRIPDDVRERVLALRREGASFMAIAVAVGRPQKAVYNLIARAGRKPGVCGTRPTGYTIPKLALGRRVCLRCRHEFERTHRGNFLCPPCATLIGDSGVTVHRLAGGRA